MTPDKPIIFLGYPSRPELLRETVSTAARQLSATGLVEVQRWEDLRVSGRLIIGEIVQAIDRAQLGAFVLTRLNHNVMFELGYAIGARKRVWLLLDDTHEPTRQAWEQISVLTTIGYAAYKNADDIRNAFIRDQPHMTSDTLFDQVIEPTLEPAGRPSLFYVKSLHENEPERHLTRRVTREADKGYRCVFADPTESTYPLSWYAQQVYAASAVLVHLTSPDQVGALAHNGRCSLIAGLVHGMKKPLLMLAEESFRTPIDYRELLGRFPTARAAVQRAGVWLDNNLPQLGVEAAPVPALRLATELKGLRLGEDVAEHEEDQLGGYFVETAGYREVLERKTTIFVGRKGTGKTANFLRASRALSEDKRVLVVVIKPWGYDMEAVVRLLRKSMPGDVRSYLIEGLWQYLLETEIALAALEEARSRPAGIAPDSPEWRLQVFCEDPKLGINEDFAVRLERMVDQLQQLVPGEGGVEEPRKKMVQALHTGPIAHLRKLLGDVLKDRSRVAVLIDNLDRGWDRASNVPQLSEMFLGLLVSTGKLEGEFAKERPHKERVELTLAVFLRSDIFYHLKKQAREPDKLPATPLVWSDPELLVRVVEQRFLAAQGENADPKELWSRFFTPAVRGVLTPSYLLARVLPRPRDLLHICSAAIRAAVNAGHNRVEESDVLQAEKAYSQFACDALRVENGVTIKELDEVLYAFVGCSSVLTEEEVYGLVTDAGVKMGKVGGVVEHLKTLSFLGVEVKDSQFRYAEDPDDARKIEVLAQKLAESAGRPVRLEVHPAFRPYLEIP